VQNKHKFPRTTVWGTIIADIAILLLFFLWFKIETDNMNIALPILAGIMALGAIYKRKAIDQCAVVMKAAMDGLASNKKIFLVCAGVTCIWAAFFALWVAAIIGMSFVKEVVRAVLDVPKRKYGGVKHLCKAVYYTGFRLYSNVSRSKPSHVAPDTGALLKSCVPFTRGGPFSLPCRFF